MVTTEELSMITPADWVPGPPQGFWTYDDYAMLPNDGHRYEIVNGVLVMAPAPSPEHQSIAVRIAYYMFPHIDLAGIGRLFTAPIDVDLGPKNMLQPDVVVVLNAHLDRVAEKKIIGAPDLVVEVASPSTAAFDLLINYERTLYFLKGSIYLWQIQPLHIRRRYHRLPTFTISNIS
jgi:Uma2 family endonuclease